MLSIHEFNKIKELGTRRCCKCGEIKPIEKFVKDKRKPDGRDSRCYKCFNLERRSPEWRSHLREYMTSWREKNRPSRTTHTSHIGGFIYVFKWQNFYKIGRAKNPEFRIKSINAGLPFSGEIVCVIPTNNMAFAETHLHDTYSHLRKGGEWFELSDNDVSTLCAITFIQANEMQVIYLAD